MAESPQAPLQPEELEDENELSQQHSHALINDAPIEGDGDISPAHDISEDRLRQEMQ